MPFFFHVINKCKQFDKGFSTILSNKYNPKRRITNLVLLPNYWLFYKYKFLFLISLLRIDFQFIYWLYKRGFTFHLNPM